MPVEPNPERPSKAPGAAQGLAGGPAAVPAGYRPAIVTGTTVVLTFSLVYFRFIVFELDSHPWTAWWAVAAAGAMLATGMHFHTLWRSLQLVDDDPAEYGVTVRWFGRGILALVVSLLASTAASLLG
jgi:hypothetical protein